MVKKYDVIVQPFEYQRERIYISLGYSFGFALKYYRVNDRVHQLNPVSILFLAYFKKKFAENELGKRMDISVNPGNTIISIVTTRSKMYQDVRKLNDVLRYVPKKEFDELKKEFDIHYLQSQKEKPNIFNLTLLEFLGQNKRFSRYELYKQIQELTHDEVIQAQKVLFENMKSNIHIIGKFNKEDYEVLYETLHNPEVEYFTESVFFPRLPIEKVAKEILVKEERKFVLLLHSNINIVEKKWDGVNTANAVFLTYQILSEKYREYNPILSIDGADFGMAIPEIHKVYSDSFDIEVLSKYILNIKKQIKYIMQEKPKLYSELFMGLWLSGINYFEYCEEELNKPIDDIKKTIQIILKNSLYCIVRSE